MTLWCDVMLCDVMWWCKTRGCLPLGQGQVRYCANFGVGMEYRRISREVVSWAFSGFPAHARPLCPALCPASSTYGLLSTRIKWTIFLSNTASWKGAWPPSRPPLERLPRAPVCRQHPRTRTGSSPASGWCGFLSSFWTRWTGPAGLARMCPSMVSIRTRLTWRYLSLSRQQGEKYK